MYIENSEFSRVLLMCTVLCTLIYVFMSGGGFCVFSSRCSVDSSVAVWRLFFYSLLLESDSDPIPSCTALCLGERIRDCDNIYLFNN